MVVEMKQQVMEANFLHQSVVLVIASEESVVVEKIQQQRARLY